MAIHHTDVTYHDYIRDYFVQRAHSVRIDANLNLLNLAVYSENFYVEFLNELFDLQLENANTSERNKAGIDLIDWENRVAVQVSVTCAPKTIREKIRNSIRKFDKPEGDWQFYFVPITDKAQDLQKDFELPDGLIFDKDRDVLDITRIMELADAAASAKKRALSALVDRYSKDETDYLELRKKLDDLLLLTWKAHRSYKLMQTDEIDQRLFPNIKDTAKFEALGKRTGEELENPVWSIIRESWNEETNRPVMIQGGGGIGKTVTLFSLTNLDKDLIPAPAVYVPMFELVNGKDEIVNLTDYFQSAEFFPSFTLKQREGLSNLATRPWDRGPSLLVLLDGFNEVPGNKRWEVLRMLRTWHEKNQGAQLIAVSRPMDNLSLETAFGKETISVTLSELTKENVTAYLKSPQGKGVRIPEPNAPIWETIVYPLFLNLYIKADRLRVQQTWKAYPLDIREAMGPGSIIWNYLQRELLRRENDCWILRCAMACEYFAPILAHHMLRDYDYTISQKDALVVIQKAASEMDLDRMPNHIAELISWWETQELSMEPPLYLKEQNWPDFLLRECSLLTPYQESKTGKSDRKQEPRFEFLHQSFRDCLAGIYLLNQAEMAGENKLPVIWGQLQNDLVLNYAAELIDPKLLDQLWEANRIATQHEDSGAKKNHIATCNLLEMYRRNVDLQKDLDFCGMDLRGLSVPQYLGKNDLVMPLFRDCKQTIGTYLDRATFGSEGHIGTISTLAVLPDGRVVSGSYDDTLRVWDAATGQCLQTLKGHRRVISCMSILPDGRVVSGSNDATLRVWDATSGECLQTLKGHGDMIYCVVVLPDGRVVSSSEDCSLRVWDTATGECLQTLKGHICGVCCVAILPDGRVVSDSWDNTIRIWDPNSGQCLQILEKHGYLVNCAVVLPDGCVVSVFEDHTLRVWDATFGQCLQTLKGHTDRILCLAVLPDGRVVSGSCDRTLRVWDTASGQCLQTLNGHWDSVMHIAALPDGRVVIGPGDNTLWVWDVTTGQCLQTLEGHTSSVLCIAVLPDGRVVSGSWDETIRIWNPNSGQCLQTLEKHSYVVSCAVVLPNGCVVSGYNDHTLRVWDTASGQCLQTMKGHTDRITCLAVLPDGRVVSSSRDRTLRVWDPSSGQCQQTLNLDLPSYVVNCVAVLPDGSVIVNSGEILQVWDVATGQCLQTMKGHSTSVTCLAVLPDGRVVSGSSDRTLRVWDATVGQCLQTMKGHTDKITCLAVLLDGRVVSSSRDHTLRVWDSSSGQCQQTLDLHSYMVNCVVVLPDGRVVTSSWDSTLRVWDVAAGQCLQTMEGHEAKINCVAVLPDGCVVSGSDDSTLRVWDVESGNCMDILEAMEVSVSGMDFTRAEITEDLAGLLCHNGAKISEYDYLRWAEANHICADKALQ